MKRDYTYFCPKCDKTETFKWTLDEFDNNKNTIECTSCDTKMLIDLTPRKIKDNTLIGHRTCLEPGLNYAKAANGRDGRSYF